MARTNAGWRVRLPEGRDIWTVRFTFQKKQVELSTGQRDFEQARKRASQIYADYLIHPEKRPRKVREAVDTEQVATEWILSQAGRLGDKTRASYANSLEHIRKAFPSLLDVTTKTSGDYIEKRLREVLRPTVKRERSILSSLLKWSYKKGIIHEIPMLEPMPSDTGTPYKYRRRCRADFVSREEVEAILKLLPEYSETYTPDGPVRYPVRARMLIQYELALRPSVMDRMSFPEHWRPGKLWLDLPASIMKAKRDSRKPLKPFPRTLAALKQLHKEQGDGLVFGHHSYANPLLRAAKAVLDPERAERFCGQHFRPARITHVLDAGFTLTAAAYLADHRHVSTTSGYARPNEKALLKELEKLR